MTAQDARDVRAAASPLREENDLDPLLERIGDARHVLPGGAFWRPGSQVAEAGGRSRLGSLATTAS
jgi:hypothetical protein